MITVESDKASMEIPSSHAGVVKSIKVKLGDKVRQGSLILELESADASATAQTSSAAVAEQPAESASAAPVTAAAESTETKTVVVRVPDIGDAHDVDVIEVLVSEGDTIERDQSLITLETEKASMEVPSSHAGVIQKILVKVGDKVSEGSDILELTMSGTDTVKEQKAAPAAAPAPAASTTPKVESKPSAIVGQSSGGRWSLAHLSASHQPLLLLMPMCLYEICHMLHRRYVNLLVS